ncbi:M23 family metallopeptidase [Flavobacterium crassostreae]|uniref:Peptidase M23 n=1 Tax=Flavobacterium crassostreae TaxID=1763534 RepID=A0A1B9E7K1_9FLAO|nr:M23 family metallopeptidase [Flavobacterium crassostreae]OCB77922.1 peptidase M23 [Flavobacterium crassostreae]
MRFLPFFILLFSGCIAQTNYPKDYFRLPLDIPTQLSGNFGELRPNHFHAGWDFKTQQRQGLDVHAVADGYVSRIKMSPYGYGKAIYITHPNGFTSVYGHLKSANGAIQDYIQKAYYREQAFEIELFLKPDELPVQKGQVIAFSGNSGSSQGPHLHFEFRDSKTEKIINPLLFGYDTSIKDSKKPFISGLYVYPLEANTVVNQSKRPLLLSVSLQKDGTYLASSVKANGKIGFGITTVDYDSVSYNKNGAYKVQTYWNGNPSFGYQLDTYGFDEMRYINALLDYPRYKQTNQRVQKLFMKTPYPLSFIATDATNGIIDVVPNLASVYRIEVSDFFNNVKIITVPITYDGADPVVNTLAVHSDYYVKVARDNLFTKQNIAVFFPAGTFYDDFEMDFDVKDSTLYLHNDSVPVHSNFTISITDSTYTEAQKEKVFIADIDSRGRVGYNYTWSKGNVFSAKVRSLGTYKLVTDTKPPSITIANSIAGKWISKQKTLRFSVSDSGSGIKSYAGYLNGNWILLEYDYKSRTLTHNFSDGIVAEGANDLKVIVTDNVGNSSTFETRFFRSQQY